MTLSIRTRTIHSRYWLLAVFGAVLLLAGCAAPEDSPSAAAPVAVTTAASTSAAPATSSADPTTPAPEATTAAPEPTTEAPAAETVAPPAPAAVPAPAPAPVIQETQQTPTEEPVAEQPAAAPSGYGCDAAIAYLQANAHPAFTIVCPGYAFGGQAVTCINHAPQCPNSAVIIINVPCAIAYMNEAANSWTIYNSTGAAIDPFGASC